MTVLPQDQAPTTAESVSSCISNWERGHTEGQKGNREEERREREMEGGGEGGVMRQGEGGLRMGGRGVGEQA